jgi:thioredoxin-like negative regulator of GroEL
VTWLGPALALLVAGAPTGKGIRWERNADAAFRAARQADKPLMVDFYAAWCGWCKRLDQTTYADPEVVRLSEHFVAVKIDTEGRSRDIELTERYQVTSLPTVAFLSPDGHMLLRVDGYQGPGAFPETMLRAQAAAQRVMAVEKALRRDPDDAEALTLLGRHVFEHEDPHGSRELLARAVKRDSALPTPDRKRNRLLLAMLHRDERRFSPAEALLLEALRLRPEGPFDAKLLYFLARTYIDWGRKAQARAMLQRLLREHARDPLTQKGRELLHDLDRP